MTSVKQICLGVAVAGVVAGAGSAAATAVAYADSGSADSQTASDSGGSDSAGSSSGATNTGPEKKSDLSSDDSADSKDGAKSTKTESAKDESTDTGDDANTTDGPSTSDDTDTESSAATEDDAVAITETKSTRRTVTLDLDAVFTAAAADAQAVIDGKTDTPAPAAVAEVAVNDPEPAPEPVLPAPLIPVAPASTTGISTTSASTTRRSASIESTNAEVADASTPHVLVIGIDGTNLGRILSDPTNENFFDFMDGGVTSASTIAGHTTISNPSWTTILTGVWDTKSGVINNVFTPATYNKWPTVFNTLEGTFGNGINTTVIADWKVIADIGNAGSNPADLVTYIPQLAGDGNWSLTDAAVTSATRDAILGADADTPTFLFSYLVQVDEAGHAHGGASQQYKEAIQRTNTNIGAILEAVANSGEEWTVIMVTDHGHQPQLGFGHGFQTPTETTTFVMIDGQGFDGGKVNLSYSIVDITPTVVTLFGGPLSPDYDGVSLTTLGDSDVQPVDLKQALDDAIHMYGYPDIGTQVALSVRTIAASIPYFLDQGVNTVVNELRSVADSGIIVVSPLAWAAIGPVQFIGDSLYAITTIVAHIVGYLTGAGVIQPSSTTNLQILFLPDSNNALCQTDTDAAVCV